MPVLCYIRQPTNEKKIRNNENDQSTIRSTKKVKNSETYSWHVQTLYVPIRWFIIDFLRANHLFCSDFWKRCDLSSRKDNFRCHRSETEQIPSHSKGVRFHCVKGSIMNIIIFFFLLQSLLMCKYQSESIGFIVLFCLNVLCATKQNKNPETSFTKLMPENKKNEECARQ